ncbi:MAG: hypothetical protein RIR48_3548 [Bacteroidota bacterium]
MIQEIVGKIHPLVVHLPIGILILALILKALEKYKYQNEIKTLLPIIIQIAFIFCVVASVTGFVLHLSGEYDESLVHNHMYLGVTLTVLVGGLYFTFNHNNLNNMVWIASAIVLTITGHLGGSLTHGENYLTFTKHAAVQKPNIDMNHSVVFRDVIQPILREKCVSCHSDKKQKGDLRLDSYDHIIKGGENGAIITKGKSAESAMLKKIQLPESDEKHMPPKGKPQLTGDEIKLIAWWIDNGADKDKTIAALTPGPEIKSILLSLNQEEPKESHLPKIGQADQNIINTLKGYGFLVQTVSREDNYLSVDLTYCKNLTSNQLKELLPLKSHIIRLKATGCQLGNDLIPLVAKMDNLLTLFLDHSNISDNHLVSLNSLKKLRYLNLTNTSVTNDGFKQLNIPALQNIYLYGTKIDKTSWNDLANQFKGVQLDTGGYVVPIWESDTTEVVSKENN